MKKIKQQLKHLANRSGPIASATGAVTSKDISFLQGTQDRNGRSTDEVYSEICPARDGGARDACGMD